MWEYHTAPNFVKLHPKPPSFARDREKYESGVVLPAWEDLPGSSGSAAAHGEGHFTYDFLPYVGQLSCGTRPWCGDVRTSVGRQFVGSVR